MQTKLYETTGVELQHQSAETVTVHAPPKKQQQLLLHLATTSSLLVVLESSKQVILFGNWKVKILMQHSLMTSRRVVVLKHPCQLCWVSYVRLVALLLTIELKFNSAKFPFTE